MNINAPTMAELDGPDHMIASSEDFPNEGDFIWHISARVFGHLAKTAGPIVTHYHSDLFHDAINLQAVVRSFFFRSLIDGEVKFVWGVDDCGTNLETNTSQYMGREIVFDCRIYRGRHSSIHFEMIRRTNNQGV